MKHLLLFSSNLDDIVITKQKPKNDYSLGCVSGYSSFDDLIKDGALDSEVLCSWLSKEMENDLFHLR